MNIQTISIKDIKPDDSQPRKYFDDEAMQRLTQSIKDNGIESPITVRENGKGYVIVDGERRWRASQSAGLKDMPCIVTEKEDVLEQQLRSDCLKEGLTVDELDRAIYRYYELMLSTSLQHPAKVNKGANPYRQMISDRIGKSVVRVDKAIDRFEFKRDNAEFTKQIEKEHNPKNKEWSKVNSTIAMTNRLKDKPEVRKAVIEEVLKDRKADKPTLDNESIKQKVDLIVKSGVEDPKDAKAIIVNHRESQSIKQDPRYIFQNLYWDFMKVKDVFEKYKFSKVKEHIQGKLLSDFIKNTEKLLEQLHKLEEK